MYFSSASFLVSSSGNKYILDDSSSKNYICGKDKFYIAEWIIISLKKDKNYSLLTRTERQNIDPLEVLRERFYGQLTQILHLKKNVMRKEFVNKL